MFKRKLISSLLTANPNLKNQGFSWLWLIGIVSIGGVGFAIVLPSFLNSPNRCKSNEAKQYVGAMNRGQQAYFLENHTFAKNLEPLGLGIKSKTEKYQYLIETTSQVILGYGTEQHQYLIVAPQAAFNYGVPLQTALRSYVGAVVVIPAAKNGSKSAENEDETTARIICEANATGQTKPAAPVYQNGNLECGVGTRRIR